MIQRYVQIIEKNSGRIHRLEQHSRQLAYPIQKVRKATYVLMNIECDKATQQALEESFGFNDAIIRHAFFKQTQAITEPSIFNKDSKVKKKSTPPVATDTVPAAEKPEEIEEVEEEVVEALDVEAAE
jgi:small subunit ribosomal protein S6